MSEFALHAEQAVLGSLLLDSAGMKKIAGLVDDKSFLLDSHRRIFRHIRRLADAGHAVDVVIVADAIDAANETGQTGGLAYLSEMANAVASTKNIKRHAELIRKSAIERQALAAIEDFNGTGDLAERAVELSQTMAALAGAVAERSLPASRPFSEVSMAGQIVFDYTLPGLRTGNVGVFAGYGGVGKGFLGLALAIDVALGKGKLTGMPLTKAGKALFVSIEDDQEALDARLQAYSRHLDGFDRGLLDDALRVVSVYGLPGWQLLQRDERGALRQNKAAVGALIEAAQGARLLILDTARKLFAFDENKSDEASLALLLCDQIARESGAAVLLVHHLSKPTSDSKDDLPTVFSIRGSSALVADARWAAILATPPCKFAEDKGIAVDRKRYRILDVGKVNHGGEPAMQLLRQDERGALVAEAWPPQRMAGQAVPQGKGKQKEYADDDF